MLARRLTVASAPLAKNALRLNAPAVTSVISRLDSHGPPADYKFPKMDELPIPCGDWKENYDNYQRKYNIHLLFGIGLFTITYLTGIYSGAFNTYSSVPEKPGPRQQ